MTSKPPSGHPDPHFLQRLMADAHADDPDALGVGLQALNAAMDCLETAAPSRDLPSVFAAAAEAVWWICSLDENLNGGDNKTTTEYAEARDAEHSDGRCIPGLRWVRDRHTHQMFRSSRWNPDFYLDPRPGAGMYVPAGGLVVWRLAELIYPQGQVPEQRRKRDARLRPVYVECVQDSAIVEPLQRATRWLTSQIA